jgi:hexosaminidase
MAVLASYPELGVTRDSTIRVNPGSRFWRELEEGGFELLINNTLNPVDEKVYDFLEKVFTEIAELFPFEYIHIGGDECYKGFWLQDEEVLSFMQTNAISSGEELQSYFTNRVSKIIAEKGKTVVGWDEILEGGASSGAVVMSWRGLEGGITASKLGHNVILSPNPEYYLDLMQGDRSIEAPVYSTARLIDTYTMNLLPEGLDPDYVLGGQGNLWTEQVPTEAQAEYMTYPRIFAIAETVWSPKDKKNWNSFVKKTEEQFKRLSYSGINYSKSMYDPIVKVRQANEGRLLIDLSSEIPGADIYYTVDNTMPCAESPKYIGPIVFPPGADMLKAVVYIGDQPMGHLIRLDMAELRSRLNKEK